MEGQGLVYAVYNLVGVSLCRHGGGTTGISSWACTSAG